MKKLIISLIALVLASVWAVKFYTLNNSFKVRDRYPKKYYSMHDKIKLDDCLSGGFEISGYSISVDAARLIKTSELIKELNCEENFRVYSDECIVLTYTFFNESSDETELNLVSFPIMGYDWYTISSYEITNYLNPQIEEGISPANTVVIPKGEKLEVKVAYELYKSNFSPKQWNDLEKLDIWVWASVMPIDQRIKISLG